MAGPDETQPPIPLARPSIGDAERAAVMRVLEGSQLTNGPEVLRLEERLKNVCQRGHAIAVSSGTTALELCLRTLGIGPGDTVLVTAFGFPAAANAAVARGARVVAIDVCPDTWLLDFQEARERVDASTKALVTIDQLGLVTSAEAIQKFEADTNIPVISDAACGLGGFDSAGKPAACTGQLATLSFHPRKVITTGEGGAILCDDSAMAQRLRQLRNHGLSANGFETIGTNGRLGECAAALGCAQLSRLESMVRERGMLAQGYKERLAHLKADGKLTWQDVPKGARHAYQTFAVRLDANIDRDYVRTKLLEKQIECQVATYSFPELSTHPDAGYVVNAKILHERGLALPLYIGMRSKELDRVCETLTLVLQGGGQS